MALEETIGGGAAGSGRGLIWVGRIVSAVPVAMLLASSGMKLTRQPQVLEFFVGKFGYPEGTLLGIGLAELACAVLYAIPRTAVLGAILLTGYMGGAMATHVRLSEPFLMQFGLGVLAWGGLFLRDPRVRALLPLRQPE